MQKQAEGLPGLKAIMYKGTRGTTFNAVHKVDTQIYIYTYNKDCLKGG